MLTIFVLQRGGIDGDIEYDTDSSGNSGIYEPINPELKKKQEKKSSDLPPELPPADKKKKKNQKEKSGKTFGSKLKQMYKSKSKDGRKDVKKTKMKHVTSDSAIISQGSSGMLNKLGKLYKRVKSDTKFQNEPNEQEEVVISSSDYDASDTNPLEENENIDEDSDGLLMHDIDYIDASSTLDNLPQPPVPPRIVEPPLPPKQQKEEPPPVTPPARTGNILL